VRLNKAQAARVARIAESPACPDGVEVLWIDPHGRPDGGVLVFGMKNGDPNWIEVVEAAPTSRIAWDLGR
jgi:hypothetical protein